MIYKRNKICTKMRYQFTGLQSYEIIKHFLNTLIHMQDKTAPGGCSHTILQNGYNAKHKLIQTGVLFLLASCPNNQDSDHINICEKKIASCI